MNNTVLCIDPGPTKSGYAIINRDLKTSTWTIKEYGTVAIEDALKIVPSVHLVLVEDVIIYSFAGPFKKDYIAQTLFNLGRLFQECKNHSIEYVGITRREIIKKVLNKKLGRSNKVSKKEMQECVKKQLGLNSNISPQHANDAVCVALSFFTLPNHCILNKKIKQKKIKNEK